jgi:hypothetical protein
MVESGRILYLKSFYTRLNITPHATKIQTQYCDTFAY